MIEPRSIRGGFEWKLDNGAAVRVRDISRGRGGRLFVKLEAVSDPGGSNEAALGGGYFDLADPLARYKVAKGLSTRNGGASEPWDNVLLGIFSALEDRARSEEDEFGPVELAGLEVPPPPRFIVGGIVPESMLTEGYGDNDAGKSTTFDHMGLCIVTGSLFLGRSTIKGPVVKLDYELNQDITAWRVHKLAKGMGLERIPEGFYYQSLAQPLEKHFDDLVQWCANIKPVLVEIDSLGPAMGGDPLNHEQVIQLMLRLRRVPAATLTIDHQSKPVTGQSYSEKRSFGSGYKGHLARSGLQVEMVTKVPGKASIVMRQTKNNFGPRLEPLPYHINYEQDSIRFELGTLQDVEFLETDALPATLKIEYFLREHGPATKDVIIEATGLNPRTFNNTYRS